MSSPKIYRFKQIDSTNSAAFRYARKGAASGSVFVADYQTRGRGKWGRTWVSPRGKNLLFSLLLRPKLKASEAPGVTQIACRSVAKVLEKRYKLHPTFKRPNDLLVGGKKICGVLVEGQGRATGEMETLVIGVGLNVNAKPDELVPGATSVAAETGKREARAPLLKSLVSQLKQDLKEFGGLCEAAEPAKERGGSAVRCGGGGRSNLRTEIASSRHYLPAGTCLPVRQGQGVAGLAMTFCQLC